MAWTDSRAFAAMQLNTLTRGAAYDLDTDSHKCALFNNSVTPDRTAALGSIAYNTGTWVTANEVSQAGQWAAAGITLTSVTVAQASGVVTFDAADTASGTAATLTNAFGALVYDDTLTTPTADPGISFNYFGGAQSVTAGQLIVVWSANGIVQWTT